jgi:hypothetical protein
MHSNCRHLDLALLASIALLTGMNLPAFAKGGGVGYWLEGKVTSVRLVDTHVELVIRGRLTLDQYSGAPSTRQSIHYECERGISASLSQWEAFFAMSVDWRGGALRGAGGLDRLVQSALKRGNVIKMELQKPNIHFTDWQCPVVKAEVIRATDPDLK